MTQKERTAQLERENRRLRELVAELDALPRKKRRGTLSDLRGVQEVSSLSKGVRSIPQGRDSYYLDLFLLQRERERLTQETVWLKKRRLRIGRRVAEIGQEMARSKEIAAEEEKAMEALQAIRPLLGQARQQGAATYPASEKPARGASGWRTLAVEY